MKILKWSNSTSLKMKQVDMRLLCPIKNDSARNQMESLKNNKNIKELEVLQQQVNKDDKYLIENK